MFLSKCTILLKPNVFPPMKGSRPLTKEEITKARLCFTGSHALRNRALFELGLKTGFRGAELLSLKVKDVFQQNQIVDRVTVQRRNMKKKFESRTILLHPEAKLYLQKYIETESMNESEYLFKSQKAENRPITPTQARRVLNKVFRLAGIAGRLATHCMRKTFANEMHEKLGRDITKTQKALGHKNINSTVSYLSFKEEEIDQAVLEM